MSSRSSLVVSHSPSDKHPDIPPEETNANIVILENYRQRLTPKSTEDHRFDSEILCFPITVDESLSAEAQQLVTRSCGDSIISLNVEPLLKKHQSKIWITMKAAAWSIAVHAIIGLSAAELGLVTHIHSA